MTAIRTRSSFALAIALSMACLLAGCAAERLHREGQALIAKGDIEAGLSRFEAAIKEDPSNAQYRVDLHLRRTDAVNRWLGAANADLAAYRLNDAERGYRRVLTIDPDSASARAGLQAVGRYRTHADTARQAKDARKQGASEQAVAFAQLVLSDNPLNAEMLELTRDIERQARQALFAEPTLDKLYSKPITLEFRDANLKMVFEVLSRSTGLNFVLDKDVGANLKTTIFLKKTSLEDAVDFILASNQLEKKVLDKGTVLIYPSNAAKAKDYQDLAFRAFYIANADVKQTATMLRTMLKTKDIYVDEKANLIMVRERPEVIRLAERLIALQDLNEPEVMLEVEVLEVRRSRLLELGVALPNSLSLTPLSRSGASTGLTLSDLRGLNSDRIAAGVGPVTINARKEDGDVNLLANPKIRTRNREKSKIMIGDKVPVITTTVTSTGFASENIQYLDVGLKLEVEPNIHLHDDVTMKVALEVSSLGREIRTSGGSLAFQVGSRAVSTVLRLKDGETQMLAGLISDEDRSGATKVPGLGELPMLGRLFSSHRDDAQKTEIVLSITPRVVRPLDRMEAAAEQFWSGTESVFRTKQLTLGTARNAALDGARVAPATTPAPARPRQGADIPAATGDSGAQGSQFSPRIVVPTPPASAPDAAGTDPTPKAEGSGEPEPAERGEGAEPRPPRPPRGPAVPVAPGAPR